VLRRQAVGIEQEGCTVHGEGLSLARGKSKRSAAEPREEAGAIADGEALTGAIQADAPSFENIAADDAVEALEL
jgi:hypothetical protein